MRLVELVAELGRGHRDRRRLKDRALKDDPVVAIARQAAKAAMVRQYEEGFRDGVSRTLVAIGQRFRTDPIPRAELEAFIAETRARIASEDPGSGRLQDW